MTMTTITTEDATGQGAGTEGGGRDLTPGATGATGRTRDPGRGGTTARTPPEGRPGGSGLVAGRGPTRGGRPTPDGKTTEGPTVPATAGRQRTARGGESRGRTTPGRDQGRPGYQNPGPTMMRKMPKSNRKAP